MEPSSARGPSDVTSTPKARSPTSARCPLLSPISPHSPFFLPPSGTNVWLASADREAPDSGFGPSSSALSFAEGAASSGPLAPLSIEIPPPLSPGRAPSERELMFRQLDANFARFVRFAGRGRPPIGAKFGLPSLDIISALLDSDPSGFILRTALLPLLAPCDLRRMRLVSARWRLAVSRHARGRWNRHSRRRDADENTSPAAACSGLCDSGCSVGSVNSGTPPAPRAFLRNGAMRTTQLSADPALGGRRGDGQKTPTLREQFQSASCALLSSEHLTRCPSCACPARISPQGRSTHCEAAGGCGAVLCRSCGYPQHLPAACRRSISPTTDPPLPQVTSPEKRLRRRLLKRLSRDM